MTWRKILFAVDSAGAGGPTMNKVAHLARSLDADVALFHSVFDWGTVRADRVGSVRSDLDIREIVEHCHQELEAVARRLREAGVRARAEVRWDYPPHEGIIRQVLRNKPDLVVVQSTRHARVARLVLTHTDYRLIETCPCPLLLIKSGRPYAGSNVIAAVDPMHAHDKPATLDEAIVEAASAVSDALGAPLHVYHAYAGASAAYQEKAESRVRQLARFASVSDDRVHVVRGDAAELLPRFARSVSAGIVVMGAVSRSGLKRVFIGHTAERVLDSLACDIMVVKPPGFRSSVGRQSVHRLPKGGAARARYIW